MNKKLMSMAMALCFALASAGVSLAKDVECKVTSVEGNNVTLDCGSDASKLEAGSNVKVKIEKKKRAIEGC